ncbi:DUF6275 family protein [Megasphaera paucivorans]|uniref:Uncharacterized protein n=1 Tax=Megasphaera paucivorans TaxID=349095 RepID=A0A1G9QG05_9FIRM|nr:DUF6275 family protein [Megasphaera paucivorans]SDM09958.1 hypothetical protein SAMN05660299_00227 [Megasphaera paucivorans]
MQEKAKQIIADYFNEYGKVPGDKPVGTDHVHIVWFCKTLQNWKALAIVDLMKGTMYYEITHNGDKNETYVDVYKKCNNFTVQ